MYTSSTRSQGRTTGFTLIELLVVIAIIAILAAILFPVFAQTREKARQISCASNEKQLGLAFTMYVQDNDEAFPSGISNPPATNADEQGTGWSSEIYPYVKSTGVYKCPDDSTPNGAGSNVTPVSYFYNCNLAGPTGGGLGIASVGLPAQTVLVGEDTGVVDNVTNNAQAQPTDAVGDFEDPLYPKGRYLNRTHGPLQGVQCPTYPGSGGAPCYCPPDSWMVTDGYNSYSCVFAVVEYHGLAMANILAVDGHVKFINSNIIEGGTQFTESSAESIYFPVSN